MQIKYLLVYSYRHQEALEYILVGHFRLEHLLLARVALVALFTFDCIGCLISDEIVSYLFANYEERLPKS